MPAHPIAELKAQGRGRGRGRGGRGGRGGKNANNGANANGGKGSGGKRAREDETPAAFQGGAGRYVSAARMTHTQRTLHLSTSSPSPASLRGRPRCVLFFIQPLHPPPPTPLSTLFPLQQKASHPAPGEPMDASRRASPPAKSRRRPSRGARVVEAAAGGHRGLQCGRDTGLYHTGLYHFSHRYLQSNTFN